MKRYSSAPCLADANGNKKPKSIEEPNAREYLQLALARVLELQREIKEGTYTTEHTSDLASHNCQIEELFGKGARRPARTSFGESSSEEDLTKEVLRKVFKNLPGTPDSVATIINGVSKPKNSQLDAIHGKRIQLLGYDTCRRATVDFMKNAARETRRDPTSSKMLQPNFSGFRLGTYSRNELRMAHRRTGLLQSSLSSDQEIRDRMLRSLDLHLANKQRDYTAKLMRFGI